MTNINTIIDTMIDINTFENTEQSDLITISKGMINNIAGNMIFSVKILEINSILLIILTNLFILPPLKNVLLIYDNTIIR